jgi:hypothetical protein
MAFDVAYDSGILENTGRSFDLSCESLVIELCEVLAEADGARFTLGGFGREPWPVSVDYDMSVFLEQLPDLLENLDSGDVFRLDMYAQGTEAMLEFLPGGEGDDQVTITCSSRTAWIPDPALATVKPFDRWLAWAEAGSGTGIGADGER